MDPKRRSIFLQILSIELTTSSFRGCSNSKSKLKNQLVFILVSNSLVMIHLSVFKISTFIRQKLIIWGMRHLNSELLSVCNLMQIARVASLTWNYSFCFGFWKTTTINSALAQICLSEPLQRSQLYRNNIAKFTDIR